MNDFKNKETIEQVFTQENLAGIIEVINHLYPRETERVKYNENGVADIYGTLVHASKADAHNALVQNLMNFIINK